MTKTRITRVLLVCSSFLIVLGVSASELTIPNSFSAGTPAIAAEVNENFDAVAVAVNDNNARIAAMETGTGATFQAAEALVFGAPTQIAGAGTLLRSGNAVDLRVALSGLDQNAMYTLWWIIFNNPEECIGGTAPVLCGEVDVNPNRDGEGVNPVNPGVRNAAGYLTGPDGIMNLTGRLLEGPYPTGPAVAGFGQLNDSAAAEIHIVVQTHGAPMIGSVGTQMTIPGGACNPDCADQFALIFLTVPAAAP